MRGWIFLCSFHIPLNQHWCQIQKNMNMSNCYQIFHSHPVTFIIQVLMMGSSCDSKTVLANWTAMTYTYGNGQMILSHQLLFKLRWFFTGLNSTVHQPPFLRLTTENYASCWWQYLVDRYAYKSHG